MPPGQKCGRHPPDPNQRLPRWTGHQCNVFLSKKSAPDSCTDSQIPPMPPKPRRHGEDLRMAALPVVTTTAPARHSTVPKATGAFGRCRAAAAPRGPTPAGVRHLPETVLFSRRLPSPVRKNTRPVTRAHQPLNGRVPRAHYHYRYLSLVLQPCPVRLRPFYRHLLDAHHLPEGLPRGTAHRKHRHTHSPPVRAPQRGPAAAPVRALDAGPSAGGPGPAPPHPLPPVQPGDDELRDPLATRTAGGGAQGFGWGSARFRQPGAEWGMGKRHEEQVPRWE